MTLVSVLIPVYNVENYIVEAVESILNQTYKNIEIIAVDDCSNDNTYELLHELQKRDNRIKIYKNSENMKIVETLNFAFRQSQGEYICRMDGDDISDLERIEKKLHFLKENPEFSLVGCSVKSIDENGFEFKTKTMPSKQKLIMKTLKWANPVFHIWLAKREVYEKLNGYRNIPYVEDYDFLLRMTSLGLKYTNIDDYYGYSIRLRPGNTFSYAGIIQRKAHRYAYKLFLRRQKGKEDNFMIKEFNKFVATKSMEQKAFNYSNVFLQKALLSSNEIFLRKYFFVILSYISSSEQRKYINGRIKVFLYSRYGGE
ncbi:glycosyltransferase family 2 protein [Planococcus halocryophilus]|uniref:glycosyltransferase family 2 protein n=1 Tax=Planococcus halocryophilus TaxID=1215089 RepID=UPI001F0F4DD8|nr:glycosyltransferase family 2 protein [Planococcus halocryophilus]MCH4826787.1 glycosyltransferase [Planococcus halocryophilus]